MVVSTHTIHRKGFYSMAIITREKEQLLMERAGKAYDQAIQLLKMMDEAVQDLAFKNDPENRYDTWITLARFDNILQLILLHMAVSDGGISPRERKFIQQIVKYGDLLDYLRQQDKEEDGLTWDKLAKMNPSKQAMVVQLLTPRLERLCDAFVKPLAILDGMVKDEDFLKLLLGNVSAICACMSYMDGVSSKKEANACYDIGYQLLEGRWKKYMK